MFFYDYYLFMNLRNTVFAHLEYVERFCEYISKSYLQIRCHVGTINAT